MNNRNHPWARRCMRAAWQLLLCSTGFVQAAPAMLTLAVAEVPHAATVLIAESQGYFAAEGLALKVMHCAFGRICLQHLLDGQAHFATVADTPIALASFTRKNFAVVATLATTGSDIRLLARRERGIRAAADLKGKRIGTLKGTSAHYFTETFLRFHNISLADVSIVGLETGDEVGALARGSVDAAVLFDPHGAAALRELGNKVQSLPVPSFFSGTFNLVSVSAAAGASDADVSKLLRAVRRADALMLAEPARARRIVATALKTDVAQLEITLRDFDLRVHLAPPLLSSLEAQARWALRAGLAPTGSSAPDYLDFIRSAPLRQIDSRAVRLAE